MGYDQLPHAAAPCRNSSRNSTRRDRFIQENKLIVGLCIALTSLFFYLMYQPPQFSCNRKPTVDLVLRSAPLIDGHNDFPIAIRAFYQNRIYSPNFTAEDELIGMVDFPRLKKGGLRGAFWSVFVPCPTNETSFADEVYATSVHDTLQQIDLVQRLTERYPTHLRVARTAGDVRSVFRHSKTQAIASLMGIEGLHQIGNSASLLRQYYALGVRYATLTHVCHNIYADSASPSQPLHDGLSPRGREMVREMNRLGMVVDLSHTSPKTMRDALEASTAPVVFSHSNAWALHRHERNVPDDVLLQLKENGGVLMVTFVPEFLTPEPREASVKDVADVVLYVGRMIGYEHVGLGSDFDGIEYGPKGLEDVGKYGVLIRELIDRGLGLKELKGVVGDNVLRVLEAVEDVSRRMKKEGVLPLEDEVGRMFPPVVG